jgi:hypothetical protein
MEAIFPTDTGISGAFMLGWRRRPGSAAGPDSIERAASVIIKRTYDIVGADVVGQTGTLSPASDAFEIFERDLPGDVLANGDFGAGLDGWTTTGGAVASILEEVVDGEPNPRLRVGRTGAGTVRRSADLGRAVRDRRFGFALQARGSAVFANPGPQLLAALGGGGLAVIAAAETEPPGSDLTTTLQTLSAAGSADAGHAGDTLTVSLPAAGSNDQEVTYDDVTLTTIEYEGDLVPFKPEGDLVVIADAEPVPTAIRVNGVLRLQQPLGSTDLTGLGWEARVGTPRETEPGNFAAMTQALPDDFDNRYYNGYRRDRRQVASLPYLQPGDTVEIERAGGVTYRFALPATRVSAVHAYYRGEGQDDPCLWRRRTLTLALDTLVIEPDRDRAYAVWRAAWPYVEDPLRPERPLPEGDNRQLTVELDEG